MRPDGNAYGARMLCIYALHQWKCVDRSLYLGSYDLRFYAFYAVEDRNDRCDRGIFYPSDLLSDVSGAGGIKEGIELPGVCSHGVKRSVCRCGNGIDIWKSGDLVGRNSGPVLSCNIRISGKESVLRTMAGMAGKLGALIGTEPEYFFLPFFPK